ncbi:hypothetical protein BH23ACT10_BH23ACT10_28790 [soil metagenome]
MGTVGRLQVQREPLKQGLAAQRAYDPAHLVEVSSVRVDRSGAIGVHPQRPNVVDVHNTRHPQTRDSDGDRGVSLMSDADYRWLRDRYGEHLTDGIAGETITLFNGPALRGRDLGRGVLIATDGGMVTLTDVRVAAPCVEFVRYVLRRRPGTPVDETVRATLQELDHGARGYVAVAATDATISIGDHVFLATE